MKPTQDWMILEEEAEDMVRNLIIPDTATPIFSKSKAHVIVAMGPWTSYPDGAIEALVTVKVGDLVIVEGLAPRVFEYKDKGYTMARARDVICVVGKVKNKCCSSKSEDDNGSIRAL